MFFRRTGVDVKAGKTIRRDSYGFERFSDYFSSPGKISYIVCVSHMFIVTVCMGEHFMTPHSR